MPRYIDAEKLKLSFLTLQNTLKACDLINGVGWVQVLNEAVDLTQTADVAEVKHGKWLEIPHKLNARCSACNKVNDSDNCDYCPFCGAKMDL